MLVVATASGTARDWDTALHPTLVTRAHVAHAQWTTWALRAMGGASESLSHTSVAHGRPPYPQYVLGRRFWARNVTIA